MYIANKLTPTKINSFFVVIVFMVAISITFFTPKAYAAQTASLYLSPSSKVTNYGYNFSFSVMLNPDVNNVDTFQVDLSYPTTRYSVVSVANSAGSPFTTMAGSDVKSGGKITIVRGATIPYSGSARAVLDITLKAIGAGAANISMSSPCPDTVTLTNCSVVAESGTQVLNTVTGGTYYNVYSTLKRGHYLIPTRYIRSVNTSYTATMQSNGSFVVRNNSGTALWNSLTNSKGGYKLLLKMDGNLVIYTSAGKAVWQTKTANKGVYKLSMLNNGNLALYSGKGIVWSTNTGP